MSLLGPYPVKRAGSVYCTRVTSSGEALSIYLASGRLELAAIAMIFVPLPRLVFPTLRPLFRHREGAAYEAL
jgi:hypothetical protein